MRRPKMFGLLFWLLQLTLLCISNAQGTFEDAETSNDYTSGVTHQQFDLRHTIPGEPDIDYPVYSEVPSTRFECTGKHEGYYADMETRCQVFRICAHTSRTIHGFGFLCPNGTLFSQKNFVCDWYRNVNCDESEQYYSKNNVNRIGSSYDMMERVRQMMEYPIKTISQALKSSAVPQATRSHHTLKKQLELAESGLDVSETDAVQQSSRDSSQRAYLTRKQAVTRAQVESVSKSTGGNQHTQVEDAVTQQRKKLQQQRQIQRTETKTPNSQSSGVGSTRGTAQQPQQGTRVSQAKSAAKPDDEDVYVNSLGELSSDPGVSFMHESARIIAEPTSRQSSEQKRNFAEKVNVALNDLAELPAKEIIAPDYVKNLRQSNEDLILAANINNLLEEVSDDLNPSISGYQVPAPQTNKTSFRFLSRGFSSQSDRAKRPHYEYAKPKQTASTIRFTNFQSQQASSQPTVVYQSTPAQTPRALSLNSNARTVGNSVTQSYNKLPPQAPTQLTPPQRPQHLLPIVNSHAPTSPAPRIIIARAEGQRIPPNSVSSIISALVTQPQPKPTPTSYVPLDDFLTKKFGQTAASYTKTNTPTNNNNQQQTAQTQQQQQQYGQTQSQQQYYFQKAPTTPATFVGQKEQQHLQQQQPQAPYQQVAAIASTYLASPHKQQQQQHFSQQNQQALQLAQQQQLQQLQQIQKQQLKEQQYFQQFTSPQVQQQQAVRLTQPQQQQQYNTNRIYQTSHQQSLWQQPPQVFQQKQNHQYSTQQTQTYLQPKQTQQQYQSQQTTATQLYYPHQQQQQQQQHQSAQQVSVAAQQQQTSLIPPSFFNNFKQQQQQLPQFPPLGNSITSARPGNAPLPHQHRTLDEFSNSIVPPEHDNHLNIQLPALTAGLIPAPTTPVLTAQRRMDVVSAVSEAESSSAQQKPSNAYNGVSSYDVPLSSIGRLPNDITQLLRRLRAIK